MLLPLKMCKSRVYRMGALDVCPFIPIAGVSEEECVQVSKNFGARLGEEVSSSVCRFFFVQRFRLPIHMLIIFHSCQCQCSSTGRRPLEITGVEFVFAFSHV